MPALLIATAILVPALFWAGYHVYHDRHQSEPVTHLLLSFAAGLGSGVLGQLLYRSLDLVGLRYDAYELAARDPLALLAYAVLGIGVIEELAKLLPFLLLALRFKEFDEPIDGVIYASFIALGMATYENVFYFQYLTSAEGIARGIASPVVHISFASVWGYTVGLAHIRQRPLLPAALTGLALAALLHGLYDFVVIGLPAGGRPAAAMLSLMVWLWRMNAIRRMQVEAAGGDAC